MRYLTVNMKRLSSGLLLLASALPVYAQDAGPGLMLQDLVSLADAAGAYDAPPARALLVRQQTRLPVQRGHGGAAGPNAVAGGAPDPDAVPRSSSATGSRAAGTRDAQSADAGSADSRR
jgi:hypothetical protein